jgi:hypothetical protein
LIRKKLIRAFQANIKIHINSHRMAAQTANITPALAQLVAINIAHRHLVNE